MRAITGHLKTEGLISLYLINVLLKKQWNARPESKLDAHLSFSCKLWGLFHKNSNISEAFYFVFDCLFIYLFICLFCFCFICLGFFFLICTDRGRNLSLTGTTRLNPIRRIDYKEDSKQNFSTVLISSWFDFEMPWFSRGLVFPRHFS